MQQISGLLGRMWERRLRGYRAMGYELISTQQPMSDTSHVQPSPAHRGGG